MVPGNYMTLLYVYDRYYSGNYMTLLYVYDTWYLVII